ncbi:hypothetical protein KVR01_013546 [Diaporthe batatas]|uniref:uncharacterized protein n=1 Tax=Diaporthe batatas TaxID=748121 RepID=UPI001D0471D0|nr:uncharacterized protein KVR01_013546 [Diaporthe batatas]KAG8156595.1 hypothetical protein KVR01_013546 [Diaporthe batatas]
MASQRAQGQSVSEIGCELYEYHPFHSSDQYIRQLILDPGQGDNPLRGSLVTAKLLDAPSFEAISYVWGSKTRNRWIIVDGRRLPITSSMEDALRQTRLPAHARTLWADSICINQENRVEKGHQVAMMGRIYARSNRTLICLGLCPQFQQCSQDVVGLVDEVNNMMDSTFAGSLFSWDWGSFPFPSEDDTLLHDNRWVSWEEFGKCAWFGRGWVVQEAALAREAVVLWAGAEIPWIRILRSYEWLVQRVRHLMPTSRLLMIPNPHRRTYTTRRPWEARTLHFERNQELLEHMPTLEVLNTARTLDVSEPKDLIYAFMSIPTSDKVFTGLDIRPDYSRDVSHLDVYRDFAVRYLQRTQNPDLLSYVDHEESDLEAKREVDGLGSSSVFYFPSWIPRWDRGLTLLREVAYWLNATAPKVEINDNHISHVLTIHDASIIEVRAIVFDSVQYVSERLSWLDDCTPTQCTQEVVSLWRQVSPESRRLPGLLDKDPLDEALAFLSTLCRNFFDGDREEFWHSLKAFAGLLQDDRPTRSIDLYLTNKEARRISTFAIKSCQSRRFILLNGGLYGMAPTITRSGDTCAVIPGTRFPFILRNVAGKENHYQVIGRAYIQTKAWPLVQSGHPPPLGSSDQSRSWKDYVMQGKSIYLC